MNTLERNKLYKKCLLSGIPHILSHLDRDPHSKTYGCFDREYWAWATKDFTNVDLQRAIYPLTLLYLNNFEDNIWFNKPRVLDWILASFNFWSKVQHKNGSHDHHYYNEFSFVGSAFPLFEIGKSFLLLEESGLLNLNQKSIWKSSMIRSANFLCKYNELHGFISNHRLGAACALIVMYKITNEGRYKDRAYMFIKSVIDNASKNEGWLCEYGGADPGYQSLASHYLANLIELTNDDNLKNTLAIPSLRFLQYFIHPDGSVGGEYGSRNCSLYFPSGIEIFSKTIPEAEAIAAKGSDAILNGNTPRLDSLDIRNFIPMLSSYAQAYIHTKENYIKKSGTLPIYKKFERFWPEAGLFIRSDDSYYTIIGCSKGGVTKVFNKNNKELVASHAGYIAKTTNGNYFSTQFLDSNLINGVNDCSDGEIEVTSHRNISFHSSFFSVIHDRTASPIKFLLFRIFSLSIGRNQWIADWFKRNIITKLFIHRRIKNNWSMGRNITFFNDQLSIDDSLMGFEPNEISNFFGGDVFTTIYMASSKYYRTNESLTDVFIKDDLVEIVNSKSKIRYIIKENRLIRI